MRIIFLSLAAIGAASVGGTALGQALATGPGHRARPHTPPATLPGDSLRTHRRFGRGMDGGPRLHHGRSDRDRLPPLYFGLGGYGERSDRSADGFFAGGGEVRMAGSRPVYDYDRSYPYEWPSAAAPARDRAGYEPHGDRASRCTMEHGVRVCRGRR